jgi:ABC-type multidrug transport system fused ATPase/permease subunit
MFEAHCGRLQRAHARVTRRQNVWAARENRFAVGRLILASLLVMVLVGFYRSMDASQVFLGWFVFLVVFFFLSAVHRRLKRISARCEGLATALMTEMHRLKRDWSELRAVKSERAESLKQAFEESKNSGDHPYQSDFDLSGLPALWLDTCTLEEGSVLMAHELMLRGREPLPSVEFLHRIERVDALAQQSKALRRWESYRFGPLSQELVKEAVDNDVQEASSAAGSAQRPLIEGVLWLLILVQLGLWSFFFVPQLLVFMESADVMALSRPLSIFIPVLLLSAVIWESWRRRVQRVSGALGLRELRVLNALEDVQRCLTKPRTADAAHDLFVKSFEASVPANTHEKEFNQALIPVSAGRRFRFLRVTFELAEVRRNPIVWILLNTIVPYDAVTFAVTLMAHRALDGRFHDWWKDVVNFDFLAALARIKLENPEFTRAQSDAQTIVASDLSHPLLPLNTRVGNDLCLDQSQRCLLLTGSNMAGKSTLLRALGLNVLLAQVGSVVCARALAHPRLEILCAIQVSDSLESGASYFYAEVKRLAGVLQRLRQPDGGILKLFLIDEIFRGTNNRERFLGSWQVIAALLQTGAFGVLTTHDLALTQLESEVSGVRNFHLRETVGEQGLLEFDYLLRSGPCPTTNALIIMRQAGLPVELDFKPVHRGGGDLHATQTL